MDLLVDVANRRGEYLRERCGPNGNVVETLLKPSAKMWRRDDLGSLREYYESQSWHFEYDIDEIDTSEGSHISYSCITVDDDDDEKNEDDDKENEDNDD